MADKIQTCEVNLGRQIDRKADHKDLQVLMNCKADSTEVLEKFVSREDYLQIRETVTEVMGLIKLKAGAEDFAKLENDTERGMAELDMKVSKKSNIKDVCALLDMKSSK